MNNTLLIIGLCNIVIFCGSIRKNGSKRNFVAYLNFILGLFLIIASFTFFNHAE